MSETWLKRLWHGPRETIEGIPYFVTRDNVEGRTYYHHCRDPRKNRLATRYDDELPGVYPYIEVMDEGELNLWVYLVTVAYRHASSVVLNVQGRLVRWDGATSQTVNLNVWFGEVACDILAFICDEAWIDALQQLTRAPLSVLRFKGNPRGAHQDHEVTKKNVRLVADVLNAYAFLKAARQTSSLPPRTVPPAAGPPPSGSAIVKGPFQLQPDGSITGRDSRLHLPAGTLVGEIRLGRFVLKGDASGHYVISDTKGRSTIHRFHGGRWEEARPNTKG
jgi:hypothetical protein